MKILLALVVMLLIIFGSGWLAVWLDDQAEAEVLAVQVEAEAHRQDHVTIAQTAINKWFAWRRLADTVSVKDSLAADYNRFMDSLRTGPQEDE